jgi:hypothetical protein
LFAWSPRNDDCHHVTTERHINKRALIWIDAI